MKITGVYWELKRRYLRYRTIKAFRKFERVTRVFNISLQEAEKAITAFTQAYIDAVVKSDEGVI